MDFTVKTGQLNTSSSSLDSYYRQLALINTEIDTIRRSIGFVTRQSDYIAASLQSLSKTVMLQKSSIGRMSNALRTTSTKYENSEKIIETHTSGDTKRINDVAKVLGYAKNSFEELNDFQKNIIKNYINGYVKLKDFYNTIFESIKNSKLDEFVLTGLVGYKTVSEIVKTWKDDSYSDIVKQTSFKIADDYNDKYWSVEKNWKHGSAGVAVGVTDAYYSLEGGILSRREDGSAFLNPHVDAKVGVSYSAFKANIEGNIGNDMLGAYGHAEVVALEASAMATATVGLFSETGEFNPRAKLSGSLEAIAVEARAKGGVTVLGADANVEGSVYVGIGAHADVGYEDGVLSFDIGAALGVGASIKFSIDFNGIIGAKKSRSYSASAKKEYMKYNKSGQKDLRKK